MVLLDPTGSHDTDPFEDMFRCQWCGQMVKNDGYGIHNCNPVNPNYFSASCSTGGAYFPLPKVWSEPPPKPQPVIMECAHCGTPFERRDVSGKLSDTCIKCGAPLPSKIEEKKEPGKVRVETSEYEPKHGLVGWFHNLLGRIR